VTSDKTLTNSAARLRAEGWRPPAPALRSNFAIGLRILFQRSPDLLQTLPRDCYTKDIITVPVGRRPVFIVNHPETIRRVLTEDRANYPKSDLMVSALSPLLGDGVLISSGELWEHDRQMLEPAFMHMRLVQMFPDMREAVQDFVERLQLLDIDANVDLESELTHVTADIMLRTIFSKPIGAARADAVFEAFSSFQANSPQFQLQHVLASDPRQPGLPSTALLRDATILRDLLGDMLDERLTLNLQGKVFVDFAQAVIDARDAAGVPFGREKIIDQLAVFFLAGHETTASSLCWTFFMLSQQPQILRKIRDEIRVVLADRPFEFDDFKSLSFARDVFRESLRLYPPAAFLTRRALHEDKFGRLKVPADSFIVISPWLIHRHRAYWPQADRFIPERFDVWGNAPVPGTYLPFGLGPRACTGATIAQLEASLILCEVLRRFSFIPLNTSSVFPVSRVSVRPANGIRCRVEKNDPR
jgi:cytochrome P450